MKKNFLNLTLLCSLALSTVPTFCPQSDDDEIFPGTEIDVARDLSIFLVDMWKHLPITSGDLSTYDLLGKALVIKDHLPTGLRTLLDWCHSHPDKKITLQAWNSLALTSYKEWKKGETDALGFGAFYTSFRDFHTCIPARALPAALAYILLRQTIIPSCTDPIVMEIKALLKDLAIHPKITKGDLELP